MKVIYDIIKICPIYEGILSRLKALTVCRLVGIYGEFLEISPSVADYVQRNDFKISGPIQDYLKTQFNLFYKNIDAEADEDFETLKFYLREAMMEGKSIPAKFLYATLYLTSVRGLYDKGKYERVIDVVGVLKENDSFPRMDESVQTQLQRYYCMALARETNEKFYTEVEWFRRQTPFNRIEYDFLRGFMFRQNGEFDKAIERYNKILEKNPRHRRSLRELVSSYRGLEDYENFGEYAEMNYNNDSDNPYHIQPYFEFLLHKKDKEEYDLNRLNNMLSTIERIHQITSISAYYELNAQYAMYIENDYDRALHFLKEGDTQFPHSPYILRTYFDCHELKMNISGMGGILAKLKECSDLNRPSKISYQRRQIIYQAYQGKSYESINLQIRQLASLSDSAKEKLSRRVKKILEKRK